MADGTDVSYNGVILQDCETLQFEQEIVYDDSNTDMVFSKFHIRVACSVHSNVGTQTGRHGVYVPGLSSGSSATVWMKRVQELLSHPRGNFTYSVGGEALVYATPLPGSVYSDCDNGPKPTNVTITGVMGKKLYRIEFGIIVCKVLCAEGIQSPSDGSAGAYKDRNVLNNRWTISEERDAQFFTTRTVEGVLRTAHIVKSPHMFRFFVLPPLQDSFKRESMRFWDSADGLTLHYQIVDKQRYAAPPPPCINWYATYTESLVNQGMLQFGEVRIVVEGAPDTDKRELLTAGMKVVLARLTGLRRVAEGFNPDAHSCFIRQLAVVEHLHENRVEITCMVQHNTIDEKYLNLRIAKIGEDLSAEANLFPTYDAYKWPRPNPYYSMAPIGFFAKYWQDPCNDTHGFPDPTSPPASNPTQKPTTPRKPYDDQIIPPGNGLPQSPSDKTSDVQSGTFPYTHYEVDNEYDIDPGRSAFPVSSVNVVAKGVTTTLAFQLHSGFAKRIVQVHAERVGAPPSFATPTPWFIDQNGVEHLLLRWKVYPSQPTLLPDGNTLEYSCQVRYEYALSRPLMLNEMMRVGGDPRIDLSDTAKILNLQSVLSLGNP